jgi:hypothetical protein
MIIVALLEEIRAQLSKNYFHNFVIKRKTKLTMGNSPCEMRVSIERPNDEDLLIS